MAAYYSLGPARDNPRSYTEDSIALNLAPDNTDMLGAVGSDELSLGRWETAREHFEHAARLDPRSGSPAEGLGRVLLYTRHYSEAEQALDRALPLVPANLQVREIRAMGWHWRKATLSMRGRIIRGASKEVDPTALSRSWRPIDGLCWTLDEAQQRLLLRLTPSAFDDSRGTWGIELAQT